MSFFVQSFPVSIAGENKQTLQWTDFMNGIIMMPELK